MSRAAFKKGLRLGPRVLARMMAGAKRKNDRVCRKCTLRLPQAKVTCAVVAPDGDADPNFVLPRLTDMVDIALIKRAQKTNAGSRPAQYKCVKGVWRNNDGEAWIPDNAKQLQHLLYAVAHQGPSGHRGREVTMQHLRGRVHWTNMEANVREWPVTSELPPVCEVGKG